MVTLREERETESSSPRPAPTLPATAMSTSTAPHFEDAANRDVLAMMKQHARGRQKQRQHQQQQHQGRRGAATASTLLGAPTAGTRRGSNDPMRRPLQRPQASGQRGGDVKFGDAGVTPPATAARSGVLRERGAMVCCFWCYLWYRCWCCF